MHPEKLLIFPVIPLFALSPSTLTQNNRLYRTTAMVICRYPATQIFLLIKADTYETDVI